MVVERKEMKEQFRILVITAFVVALGRSLSSCASAPAPVPSTTPTVAPPATVSTVPPATATVVAPATAGSSTTPSPASAAATSKTVCLACHPYNDVIAASANYVMPSGETHSPHRYVDVATLAFFSTIVYPHNSIGIENIPECGWCHAAHPLPLTGPVDLSNMGLDFCYSTCHHPNNFAPCSKCHIGSVSAHPEGP
jgi:hypothetical protein